MSKTIFFNSRDELLRMEVNRIVYFEADGNYTHIVSMNKLKSTVSLNLTKTEQALTQQLGAEARQFMRVGKRFIINTSFIYSVNIGRQTLTLSDQQTFGFQLPVSKDALRIMKSLLLKNNS